MKTYWSEQLQKYVTVPNDDMDPATAAKKVFMMNLVDEFKDFVSDSIDEGMDTVVDDHMDFLEACMSTFIEMKLSEEK